MGRNKGSSRNGNRNRGGKSGNSGNAPVWRSGISENRIAVIEQRENSLVVRPCEKGKDRFTYPLARGGAIGVHEGDVVIVEEVNAKGGQHFRPVQRLGHKDDPGIQTTISIHQFGLRHIFSKAALNEAQALQVPDLDNREDLRHLPLVTIDPVNARDFDDAVFAEPTKDGGHHIVVAIADVAWYVRPGTALDKEAYHRGNSTYFPDRVIPMLPEVISNGLCSLKPKEDRACMGFHMWIDSEGELTGYKPFRGLMHSQARLTYEQAQAARDGNPDATTAPLIDKVIKPLYAAYEALNKAREKRGTLTFEKGERRVTASDDGVVAEVKPYNRIDSQKLIEEFMILTNVSAAKALEDKGMPCIYRVHDEPANERGLERFKELLKNVGIVANNLKTAADFKVVLDQAEGLPQYTNISTAALRAQSKAVYTTKNNGHFGLALDQYAHFTSPIRRDADLFVHRAIISAYNLGEGGLAPAQKQQLSDIAKHISETEVASARASWAATDRLTAKFLEASVGNKFEAKVQNITPAGMFVELEDTGANGLVPMKALSRQANEFFDFDPKAGRLTGRKTGAVYASGTELMVRLKHANSLSGSLMFEPANDDQKLGDQPKRGKTGTGPAPTL